MMHKIKLPKRCLSTSKGIITFDAYDLINEVRSRPILWNKSCSNRIAVYKAWNDLSRKFVLHFDQLNGDEQFSVANFFRASWKNITNLMMKNYNQKLQGNRKICLYHHTRGLEFYLESRGLKIEDVASERELQELDELDSKRRAASKLKRNIQKELKVNNVSLASKKANIDHIVKNTSEINKCRSPILGSGSYDTAELGESDENNGERSDEYENDYIQKQPNISYKSAQSNDADQAFFDSLKPFLRKANESQKLEFKIQVLELIRKYRTS